MIGKDSTNAPLTLSTHQSAGVVSPGECAAGNASRAAPRTLRSAQLPDGWLAKTKLSFNARRLAPAGVQRLLQGDMVPHAGDLVLARIAAVGQHERIQLSSGRQSHLYLDDEVVVVYGDRYAPKQWEAHVPDDLGPCHLAAAGGLAARVILAHRDMEEPTVLHPIGLLADVRGRRMNLAQLGLSDPGRLPTTPPTIVVVGTSMDSGKTTSAAALMHGLCAAGLRVGALKVTGTGACGDLMKFLDAGAAEALDFVDAGLPTTYRQPPEEIERVLRTLVATQVKNGAQALVIEIADGLLQDETARLLRSPLLRALDAGFVFTAVEAIAAIEGERSLRALGHDVRAISGLVTVSPLSVREVMSSALAPVLGLVELSDPETASRLLRLQRPLTKAE